MGRGLAGESGLDDNAMLGSVLGDPRRGTQTSRRAYHPTLQSQEVHTRTLTPNNTVETAR
eukprot:1801611-Prymnesium_polylepis.1